MAKSTITLAAPPADEAADALRLDRDRDGLLVFFVCVILFCVAAAVYLLTDLLVAAAPVVMLASGITISRFASNAPRRVVGQWGGAGGAICEDHFRLVWLGRSSAGVASSWGRSNRVCLFYELKCSRARVCPIG